MIHDHDAARLRRIELEREIDCIRTERLLHGGSGHSPGLATRSRHAAGRALIVAGKALVGGDGETLHGHRA